ncbi:hypothetical protein ASG88_19500 [Nocardioides sp. Soil777]|nr:hypothetical protein ASG88_19500 [Nocardioides sp. Soil777]
MDRLYESPEHVEDSWACCLTVDDREGSALKSSSWEHRVVVPQYQHPGSPASAPMDMRARLAFNEYNLTAQSALEKFAEDFG